LGALITVYLKGSIQIFWTYPALMVAFYLLKPKEALILVFAAAAALLPALFMYMEFAQLAAVMVTLLITNSIAFSFSNQSLLQQEQLMELAACDPLTGTGNRRGLQLEMARVTALRSRIGTPCSLLLIDLDKFKAINDVHGHNVGDEYLGENGPNGTWRDTHILIEGPAVQGVQLAFAQDWHWATNSLPALNSATEQATNGDKQLLVLPSGPADQFETFALIAVQLIHMAKKRLWIVSPYFVPDIAFDDLAAFGLCWACGLVLCRHVPG